MNRRGFLKLLGMAPIAAVAGPALGSAWFKRSPLETVKALKAFSQAHWDCEGFAVGRNVYASYYEWLTDTEYGPRADRGGERGLAYTKFVERSFEDYEFIQGKPIVMDPALYADAITTRRWPRDHEIKSPAFQAFLKECK
jgi:hypothetical protein